MAPFENNPTWFVALISALVFIASVPADDSVSSATSVVSPEDQAFFTKLTRKIEPDLKGDPARLEQYLRFYQQELANDARLFAFQVTASAAPEDAHSIRLTGYVEFREHRTAVEQMLSVLGFDVLANDITLLPDERLGELRFGLLTASRSFSFDQPVGDASVVTECLVGEPLFLLQKSAEHYLCHSGEGYLGYVAASDIRPVNEEQFARYLAGDRVHVRRAQTVGGHFLPAGTRLKLYRQSESEVMAQLPDDSLVSIEADQCTVYGPTRPVIEEIVATGKSLLGTKYVWGGKTNEGIDCSGLVQVAFGASAFNLPRDSNQQVFVGRLSGTRWCTSTMVRGDTMYFLGRHGRIRHTALYLGEGLYLQAESPVVTITSLDPQHPAFDARRRASFACAKRLID